MSDLLTRNRYRISGVTRLQASGKVCFDLQIGDSSPGPWNLTPEEFIALVEDLGMRPTSPEATEYESTSIYQTARAEEC
jgi:hypothetical protein